MVEVLVAEFSGHDTVVDLEGEKEGSHGDEFQLLGSDVFFEVEHVLVHIEDC